VRARWVECFFSQPTPILTTLPFSSPFVPHLPPLSRPAEHHYHLYNDAGTRTSTVILGKVKLFHVRSDIIDPSSLVVDTGKLQAVSRLGGITYGRTTRAYEMPRPVWKDEKEKEEVKRVLEGQEKA
jgi:hypothetical protein